MKRMLIYIVIIIGFLGCKKSDNLSDSQAEKFIKYFGSFSQDNSTNMLQTADEGFIIVGTMTSLTQGKEAAVIKTDKYGNEEWSQIFGDSLDNYASSVLIESDGYLILGTATDSLLTTNMWLFKLSTEGRMLWSHKYGSEYNEEGVSLVNGNQGGYILAGNTTAPFNNNIEGNKDVYCIKIDENGLKQWAYQYGLEGNDYAKQVVAYSNGYAIVSSAETVSQNGLGGIDAQLLLIDEFGANPETKTYGGSLNDYGNSVYTTAAGFVITGTTSSFNSSSQVYCVSVGIEINSINWEKNYGEENLETGNHILPVSDGNMLISGSKESIENGKDQYILKLSNTGDTLWTNTFGHTGNDIANYAIETTDGGFAILGTTTIDNNQMVSLIKTDSEGKITN
jgi:hypothetical protein